MEDFLPKTSQSEIFKGMMRNPANAKLMKEALASPIGSTSRQKAKKLFSIMNKLHASRDGMGGPGMMYDQMAYGQYPAPENNPIEVNGEGSKGMVIFHKIPKPNINFTDTPQPMSLKPNIGRHDGSGGPGDSIFNMSNPYSQSSMSPNMSTAQGPAYRAPDGTMTYMNQPPAAPAAPTPPAQPAYDDTPPIVRMFQDPAKYWARVQQNMTPPTMSQSIKNSLRARQQDQAYQNDIGNSPIFNDISSIWKNLNPPTADAQGNPFHPDKNFDAQGNPLPGFDDNGNPLPGYNANGQLIQPQNQSSSGVDQGTGASSTTNSGAGSTSLGSNVINTASYPATPFTPFSGSINMSVLKGALASQESGGSYIKVNPDSGALGKYQIMPDHLAEIGLDKNNPSDVQRFLNDPKLQDTLYDQIINGLNTTYGGNLDKMLAAYYGGDNGAAVVGTPAGDVPQGKYPSINSYVIQLKAKMGLGSPTSLTDTAQSSVDQSTGPGMFAFNEMLNPKDPVTGGLTLTQQDTLNQKTLWDKYNIGGLQDQMMKLQAEGATLPRDVADYITGRDQYIKQTDQNIANLVTQATTSTALSDPANAQKFNAQLNYMYTLRGRQNQSYIGYLTDAVNQHQADLDNITNQYSTALNSYNAAVTSSNTTTAAQYTQYAQALADMYTAVDGAPAKLQQALLNQANILIAQGQAVSDPLKKAAQNGIITQGKQVETYWGWDGSKDVGTTPDLVKTINDLASLQPDIQPVNIIQTYANDIIKYSGLADVQLNSAGTNGANVVTSTTKKKIMENAITNFAHLYIASSPQATASGSPMGGDSTMQLLANNYLTQFSNSLAASVGGSLTKNAPNLMGAIKTLSPSGWFAAKTPPTESQFVSTFVKASGNASDSAIASAVYQAFKQYIAGTPAQGDQPAIPAGTPAGAVDALLYNTSSTTTKSVPFTPDQFAQNLGHIYATSLVQSALATQ